MAVAGVSRLGFIYTVTFCAWLFPRWGQGAVIPNPQEGHPVPGGANMVDPSLLDQYQDVDMQELLGQFLYMLNLTEHRAQPRARATHVEPPDYMLELYNRFANDRTAKPSASIVRSFQNEDSSPYSVTSRGVRTHQLLFNISVPHHERVVTAELRLCFRVVRLRHRDAPANCKVTVFEKPEGGPRKKGRGGKKDSEELVTRQVEVKESGWEVFDLTDVVHHWRRSGSLTHRLEVHTECLNSGVGRSGLMKGNEQDGITLADMDNDQNPEGKHKSALIVFSDDKSKDHRKETEELNQMIKEEGSLQGINELWESGDDDAEEQQSEEQLMQMRSNLIYANAPRIRRSAKGNPCKKTPFYVEFKDIGWDKWIVAPPGYEAYECSGVCSFPLTSHVTPTKHAIIRTLISMKNSQRTSGACCVPTKLEPISILYENENGVVVYEQEYEGMVVAECGCR